MTLRERILSEALRQFSRKGYLGTSISEILEGAGASKGGLYNHFKSKEDLFFAALSEARKIWRERNLAGLEDRARPLEQLIQLLENYRDRYLTETERLPGGCIFVNLAVELGDRQPHLAQAVHEGFTRLKTMMKRLLDTEASQGRLRDGVDTGQVTELLFSGLLGACVVYAAEPSREKLDGAIAALVGYLEGLRR